MLFLSRLRKRRELLSPLRATQGKRVNWLFSRELCDMGDI